MKTLFNNNWQFKRLDIGADINNVCTQSDWCNVNIPHDWLINNTAKLYETGEGWYRKTFVVDSSDTNGVVSLIFDGVYMNTTVFVNNEPAGDWAYGYTPFCIDITPFLKTGKNEILVRVRHEAPNTRWYSGAGIYRNVWINKQNKIRIVNDGVYINTKKSDDGWCMRVETEFEGEADRVLHTLYDMDDNVVDNISCHEAIDYRFQSPILWDIDNPYLYKLKTQLIKNDEVLDEVTNPVGFRTIEFSPQDGFFLNGRYLKMHGVCLHHDLGALGSAFNVNGARRQIEIMKSMGVNAIRISHNPPAREFLDLCDDMGVLVEDEAFDMWELPKNKNDYARFFPNWHKKDIAAWVRRDRNHPCVILWSIGNEIYDTHKDARGLELAKMLSNEVKLHDPHGNAAVTISSNYMPFENAQKVADYIKIAGYNYAENIYDIHHEHHPDWFIYGSETVSAVRSRGVYRFPIDTPVLTCDDMQCSDLGNSVVGWGIPAEKAWVEDRDRAYCGGQFIWTGMDYIGEPTPYPAKNSYFGAVDTAGIPKIAYWFYKSAWDKKAEPFIKLFPHWDWNLGQLIDVIAYSNVPSAELFLNGKSLGKQSIDFDKDFKLHFEWRVPFEKGEILIKAYDKDGNVIASDRKLSPGEPASICIKYSTEPLYANCTDLKYVNVSVVDEYNIPVENARNRIFVKTDGIRLVGIDSGDSTDYDSYKGSSKRLFSGQLTVILQTSSAAGCAYAEFTANGLKPARIDFNILPCEIAEGTSDSNELFEVPEIKDEIPLRKIELIPDRVQLDENNKTTAVKVKLCPANSDYRDIIWKCVMDTGAETDVGIFEGDNNGGIVTARGDGRFKLRAMCKNGTAQMQIISELDFNVTGLGEAVKNPFKFILASRYDISLAPLKVIERGAVAGVNKARTIVGFKNLDFGNIKTNALRLYIGTTSYFDEIPVETWVGHPDENESRQIDLLKFPRNNLHYDFLPFDFTLSEKLSGVLDLCFVLDRRCVFGGFEFINNKAFDKIFASERDEIYGDNFTVTENMIENIGNNVIINFNSLEFGEKGADKIVISGYAPDGNSISLRIKRGGSEITQMIEFPKNDKYTISEFDIPTITGTSDIGFVFLPGSNFNLEWFMFK